MQIQNAVNTAAIFQASSSLAVESRRQNEEAQARSTRGDRERPNRIVEEQALIKFDTDQVELLDQQNRQSTATSYDAPSGKNRLAIQAYEGVGNIEQRASVQQVLGVDIFA